MLKKMMFKQGLYLFIMVIAIIFEIGSCLAVDADIISLTQGWIQLSIFALVIVWFGNLYRIETNRIASFD